MAKTCERPSWFGFGKTRLATEQVEFDVVYKVFDQNVSLWTAKWHRVEPESIVQKHYRFTQQRLFEVVHIDSFICFRMSGQHLSKKALTWPYSFSQTSIS